MIPSGQKTRKNFPRFGLTPYAQRFPRKLDGRSITLEVNGAEKIDIADALADWPRSTIKADFHCVTTWTYPDASWSGENSKSSFRNIFSLLTMKSIQLLVLFCTLKTDIEHHSS